MTEQTIDVWFTLDGDNEYKTDKLPDWNDHAVRVGKKIVGHVVEVLEVHPQAVKVRLAFNTDRIPWGIEEKR